MTPLHLYILIQVIGESLPISSSSHIFLFKQFFTLPKLPAHFDYMLHGPTLLILIIFFRHELMLVLSWLGPSLTNATHLSSLRLGNIILKSIIFICITTILAVIGYFFINDLLTDIISTHHTSIMLVGLLTSMLMLFSLRFCSHNGQPAKPQCLTTYDAIVLGTSQAIALLPGLSRFATTFVTARWLGYSWKRAFQLSFLIQLPLLLAALGFKAIPALIRFAELQTLFDMPTILVCASATAVGYIALSIAWKLAQYGHFWKFGWYMLVPIIATLFLRQLSL